MPVLDTSRVVPERKDVHVYMKTIVVAAALVISGCASGPTLPPEQQLVEDALEALGGRERVLAVTTLTIEGEGTTGNFGQNMGAAGAISPSAVLRLHAGDGCRAAPHERAVPYGAPVHLCAAAI